jgi:hypothetical protein
MKSVYGLSKPYNFDRAFPFVTAIALLILIIVITGGVAFFDKLHWGTCRFVYFFYIGSIALAAATLSFVPRLAWPLLALCFIEFSLGVGTPVLAKMHIVTTSMLPVDLGFDEPRPRFR